MAVRGLGAFLIGASELANGVRHPIKIIIPERKNRQTARGILLKSSFQISKYANGSRHHPRIASPERQNVQTARSIPSFFVVRAIGTYVFYGSFGSPAIGTYVFCSILWKHSDRNLHILRYFSKTQR